MSDFETLVILNSDAAYSVAEQGPNFDTTAADLVMRNLAVATDRLKPSQFYALSPHAVEKVLEVAAIAKEVAPIKQPDTEPLPHETAADFEYRINVWSPIHSLQRKLHIPDVSNDDPEKTRKVLVGVKLAGEAFSSLIKDAQDLPAIKETKRYFWGNTNSAFKRTARSEE